MATAVQQTKLLENQNTGWTAWVESGAEGAGREHGPRSRQTVGALRTGRECGSGGQAESGGLVDRQRVGLGNGQTASSN